MGHWKIADELRELLKLAKLLRSSAADDAHYTYRDLFLRTAIALEGRASCLALGSVDPLMLLEPDTEYLGTNSKQDEGTQSHEERAMNSIRERRHPLDTPPPESVADRLSPHDAEKPKSCHDPRGENVHSISTQGAVLIIDDEVLVRQTYRFAFEKAGHKVFVTEDGDKALGFLHSENISVVLLDILMPGTDGLETLMSIKRVSPETIVIVMSGGCANFDYLDVALKLGADEVVQKPISPAILLATLARLTCSNNGDRNADRRNYKRLRMDLPGQLFNPIDGQALECRVLNLGAGGALIDCKSEHPTNLPLVLYIEHFGRFEGTVAHHSSGLIGLKFSVGEVKRSRLKEMLASFAEHGISGITHLRIYPRFKSNGSITLARETGQSIRCDVLDISPDGISLRTEEPVPIGEVISVGKNRGRVVRHHSEGIAIQYVREPLGNAR